MTFNEETIRHLKSPKIGDLFTIDFSSFIYLADVSDFGLIDIFRQTKNSNSLLFRHYHTENYLDIISSIYTDCIFLNNLLDIGIDSIIIPKFFDNLIEEKVTFRVCYPNYDFYLNSDNKLRHHNNTDYYLHYSSFGLVPIFKKYL